MANFSKLGKIILGGAALVGGGVLLKKAIFPKKEEPIEETEGENEEEAYDEVNEDEV